MVTTVDWLKAHVICIVKPSRRNVLHVYVHVVCFVENNSRCIPLDVSLLQELYSRQTPSIRILCF